jgi:hypothetical protein
VRIKITLLALLLVPCWVIASRFNTDFANLHFTSQLVWARDLGRIYGVKSPLGTYPYPPFSLVLIEPLGALGYDAAKLIWNGLQTCAFVAFWILLGKLYPFLKDQRAKWGWLLIWIVAINPIHHCFQSNSVQLMLLSLLLGAEWLSEREGRHARFAGGLLAAAAVGFKTSTLLVTALYLLVKPRATKAGVAAGLAAVVAMPLLVFGRASGQLLNRSFLATRELHFQSQWQPWALAGSCLIFFVLAWRRRASPTADRGRVHLWALALASLPLLTPSTRPNGFVFLLPGFCSLLEILYRERLSYFDAGVTLVSASLLALTAEGVVGKRWHEQFEAWSLPTFGICALVLALFLVARRRRDVFG